MTGLSDAVLDRHRQDYGSRSVLAVTDSRFIMGSMGSVVGERITRMIEHATKKKYPVVIVSGSGGGVRMYEGMFSLMAWGGRPVRVLVAVIMKPGLDVYFCSRLTRPLGGIMASFAGVGDV